MTDGIYANGVRPKTKKALKESAKNGETIEIECTSMFGGFSGNVKNSNGEVFTVVGPCPYTKRNWYANVQLQPNGTIKVW